MNWKKEKYICFLTFCTTRPLNHRDGNMMAAYRRVGPRHRELYLYLHLHFVAPAKHRHPESPANPPPSGGTPFEGDPRWHRGAAWHHLLRRGARWQSGGGRPPCLTPFHPRSNSPSSKSLIRPVDRPPLAPPRSSTSHRHPLCPPKSS